MAHDPFSKHPLASKTVWINVLTVAVAVLTAVSGQTENIPVEWMPYIVAGLAAVNVALRFVTSIPLSIE